MRILLATHLFPPRHRAGTETHAEGLAIALAARGDSVSVVTTEEGPSSRLGQVESERAPFGTVYRILHDRRATTPDETLGLPPVEAAFSRVIEEVRPQIVHFEHLMYLGLGTPALARRAGVPVILTLHEYWLLCARNGQLLRADGVVCHEVDPDICARCLPGFAFGRTPMERRLAPVLRALDRATGLGFFSAAKRWRRGRGEAGRLAAPDAGIAGFLLRRAERIREAWAQAAVVLSPSRYLASRFLESGLPGSKLRHWPNGIRGFSGSSPGRTGPARPLRVGFLGSLTPQKGADVLLRAHSRLPQGRVLVAVHGSMDADPGHAALLRRLARKDEVVFHGAYGAPERDSILESLDIIVVPSIWLENAPLVIAEAHSAGLPVLGTDHGGVAEMILESGSGALFPRGDDEALARLLLEASDGSERIFRPPAAPRSITDEAEDLRGLYREVAGTGA